MDRFLILLICIALPFGAIAAERNGDTPARSAVGLEMVKELTIRNANAEPASAVSSPASAPTIPSTASPVTHSVGKDFDYSVNLQSEVFGANLFSGAFAREGAARFNPDYIIQVGDFIIVRLWGAFSFDAPLAVDAQGNIFIPNVGPVGVLGVRNKDVQRLVETAVRSVYRKNVSVYASLDEAQPVRVYVGGFVNRPGLYDGTSMDSLLNFLDRAGGIDPERGSFLNIEVKRGETVRANVNLYDFLLKGVMQKIQLTDGDVIYVTGRKKTVTVTGMAENAKRFEYSGSGLPVSEIIAMARPQAAATHVRVTRNTGAVRNTEYYPLDDVSLVMLNNGDELQFTADKKPGTITVRLEGEHEGAQEYVLPYGAKLSELIQNIRYYPSADQENIQLFRLSVKERQKQMLDTALRSLESSVLTARSATNEESRLRKDEAELMLQWVEKAKSIEPSGQVIIAQFEQRGDLLLENGDVIRIPKKDGLILISGEVLFPNTIAYEPNLSVKDYIKRAGGYSQSADTSRVILARRDGSFEDVAGGSWSLFGSNSDVRIKPGDQILVLPKVQTKSIEVARGISQILYQIAIATKVVLDL